MEQICLGLNDNKIQIPYDKHHGKKSQKHAQFCQICSNVKMSNSSAKYEVQIKQYLHSILDINAVENPGNTFQHITQCCEQGVS